MDPREAAMPDEHAALNQAKTRLKRAGRNVIAMQRVVGNFKDIVSSRNHDISQQDIHSEAEASINTDEPSQDVRVRKRHLAVRLADDPSRHQISNPPSSIRLATMEERPISAYVSNIQLTLSVTCFFCIQLMWHGFVENRLSMVRLN
jgi:hypothetical protein